MGYERPPLPKCNHPQCPGHLMKFSACEDEAAWQATMEGFHDGVTGDTDWEAAMTLLKVEGNDWRVTLDENLPDWRVVQLRPGAYLIITGSTGGVTVLHYESADEAQRLFDDFDAKYAEWCEENEALAL